MNPTNSANYKTDFEIFLSHTDEKQVLFAEIGKYITNNTVRSLLDIGAGNGDLSIPLSKKVAQYLAIEKNSEFARQLTAAGLKTKEAEFPIPLEEKFDMVLACHTISYRRPDFSFFIKGFVHSAWNLVNEQGVFLMIGSEGENDDWYLLMKEIGEEVELQPNRNGYKETIRELQSLGTIAIEKVVTHVRTKTIEDMISALTFIAAKGDPQRKEKFLRHQEAIETILKKTYTTPDGFAFPFYHYFHLLKK